MVLLPFANWLALCRRFLGSGFSATQGIATKLARWALGVGTTALIVWAAALLYGVPAVGAADHGDYYRVARPAGIVARAPPHDESGHALVQRAYGERSARLGRGATSAAVIAAAAKHVSFGERGRFDIRQLGLVYLTAIAAAIALAAIAGVHPGACFLLTWVLVDPGYLMYLNSLYSEPPALVALLGLVLWLALPDEGVHDLLRLEAPRSRLRAALLVALLLLGGFSRLPMTVLPGMVLGILLLRWGLARPKVTSRGVALLAVLVATAVLPPAYFMLGSGPRFEAANSFQSVFLGPASMSDDPARLLRGLGISADYAGFVGKSYFDAKPPPLLERELSRVTLAERTLAYLREPAVVMRLAERLSEQLALGFPEPDYELPGLAPRARAPWRFSHLRRAVLGAYPSLVWLVLAGQGVFAAAVASGRARSALPASALGLLAAVAVTQLFIAVLGDGTFGLRRHLLVARYAFDSACALLLLEGCVKLQHLVRRSAARPASSGGA